MIYNFLLIFIHQFRQDFFKVLYVDFRCSLGLKIKLLRQDFITVDMQDTRIHTDQEASDLSLCSWSACSLWNHSNQLNMSGNYTVCLNIQRGTTRPHQVIMWIVLEWIYRYYIIIHVPRTKTYKKSDDNFVASLFTARREKAAHN